jgi:nitroreductase
MPDLFETIETCRAMRRLKPDPVPDEMIAKILRAGICAPNGGNSQKWRFLVIKAGRAGVVQEGFRRGDRPALPQQRTAARRH